MMLLKKLILIFFTILTLSACLSSPKNTATITTVASNTLDNGLFYTIHSKQENSDKIQLRLMVKSGSLSEMETQSGYAHLLEHMAFNGTKHFPKHKIIELFEKSGLTFGHDINAYTSFDNTVYTLSVPKSDHQLLADTLLYLRDVLSAIEFDQAELDKEQGVVANEYLSRMPQEKSYDHALFFDYIAGSAYAKKLPIGTLESINNSTVASVNAFYRAWYRPDNAKLLITGDVDSENTARLISDTFSSLKKSDNNNKQIVPTVPVLKIAAQAYSSKVVNFAQTNLFLETPILSIQNSTELSQALKLDMMTHLINYRLNVLNKQRQKPFNQVGSNVYELLSNKVLHNIYIRHQQGESQQATEFIAQELARINQHGFSQAEYEQQLEQIKSTQAELANNYSNQSSAQVADAVIHAWSKGHIEYTLKLEQQAYQMLLTTVSLKELNQLTRELINRPSKLTFATPYQSSQPDLAIADKNFADTLTKPIDNTDINIEKLILPVVKKGQAGSQIVNEKFYPEKQISQWHLSNGVDVVLQPDSSVKNSISISLTAPGGLNVFTPKQALAFLFLINSYTKSDLAGLSAEALKEEFLKAKAELTPLVEFNNHGFSMHSVNNPKSLEFLFSMVHSAFTSATIKEPVFALEKKSVIEQHQNFLKQPVAVTLQSLYSTLYPDNYLYKMWSIAELQSVQLRDVESLHQTLYASANGYKLTIVGDFAIEAIKPIILHYIASLPGGEQHQFSSAPQSIIKQASNINAKTNPQDNALVQLTIITDTPNQGIKDIYQAALMERIISQEMTKTVREQLSLTYTPHVLVEDQRAGLAATGVLIQMLTKVEDAKKTQQVVSTIVNDFIKNGITSVQLIDHKKAVQQTMDSWLKTSETRQELLHRDHLLGFELGSTENAAAIINSISIEDMNRFMKAYLNPQKTLQFINLPEKP
tara:strand:+ start:13336 stop:16131 length:2796 start_codon:yes stop_codon:yes gene_type:complete